MLIQILTKTAVFNFVFCVLTIVVNEDVGVLYFVTETQYIPI
jgi:hypothetical protein